MDVVAENMVLAKAGGLAEDSQQSLRTVADSLSHPARLG